MKFPGKRDKDGFIILQRIPGSKADRVLTGKKSKAFKLPKNPDDAIASFDDEYATDKIENMSTVDIGDYVYQKGIIHSLNMNVGRNIPWLEDGLKSVERRILYAMYLSKLHGTRYDKIATITGDIIKRFHPHGDGALNDTIYRLGCNWTTMIPYIKGEGNFGTMDKMKPAAPRYASGTLSAYAMDCYFAEMGTHPIFDVKDNYNYSEKEPVYLVSKYPNILMQWNQGIGKGASAWLGAFNSKDVFDTTLKLMDNPNAKIEIYPDTPTPIQIVNKSELKHCFDQNKFSIKMRAPYEVKLDQKRDGSNRIVDKHILVFTALPVNVIGKTIVDEIIAIKAADMKRSQANKKLPEVINIENIATNKTLGGIEVIIEYEKGYDPNALAEKLYKSTSLGTTVAVQYTLITDNKPDRYTPRQILNVWINQRYDQKRRYYHQQALSAAKDRARLDAICTILATDATIDKAIEIIRSSSTDSVTIARLMKEFDLTEFQASSIVEIKLKNLQKMDIAETRKQRDIALAEYKRYRKLLTDDGAIKDAIREDLIAGKKKYAFDRRAILMNLKESAVGDQLEKKWIFWNRTTYFALSDTDNPKALKDRLDMSYRVVRLRNSDRVLVFFTNGAIKLLDGFAFASNHGGIGVQQMGVGEIASIVPVTKDTSCVAMITSAGYGKLMDVDSIMKATKSKVISLGEGDYLAGAIAVNEGTSDIVGMSSGDRLYYAKLEDFPMLKRISAGNRIIKVEPGTIDRVFRIGSPMSHIMIYGEYGYAKVIDASMLKFNRKRNQAVDLQGKMVLGAIPIAPEHMPCHMIDDSGIVKTSIVVDKAVTMTTEFGETHRFKIGTSIGNPVKILKRGHNEFYQFKSKG